MKRILLRDYVDGMGTFIDINYNPAGIVKNYIHIPYEKLLSNYKELLSKGEKYFIYCNGGVKSRKAVNILNFYGYDVTLVVKE